MILGLYLAEFVTFLGGERGQRWLAEINVRKTLFQAALGKETIDLLTEERFLELFQKLSTVPPKVGERLARTLLEAYGFASLREHLRYFLWGDDPLEERFDELRRRVPELASHVLTELAMYAAPRDFCVWDQAARRTVAFVGQSQMHGLSPHAFTDTITGLDYVAAKVAMNQLQQAIRAYAGRKVDFTDAHLFTRYIVETVIPAGVAGVQSQ